MNVILQYDKWLAEHYNQLKLNNFTDSTNRSNAQTAELLDMMDGDWNKVREIEKRIKGHNVGYFPGDKEEAERILAMPEPDSGYLHEWNVKLDPENRWALIFTAPNGKTYHVAVPSTDGSRVDIIEFDYIDNRETTNQWRYHYDCTPDDRGNFKIKGLQIHIVDGQIISPANQ